MSVKIKIFGVFAVSLLMAWGALALVATGLFSQNAKLESDANQTISVAEGYLPLVIHILEIKTDVIQVQQWLTDISATRGAPGFDDGYDEAAGYADRFNADVKAARKLAAGLRLPKVMTALDQLEKAFPAYYEGGREMAQAYIASGPEGGNLQMGVFDGVAQVMGEATETLVKTVEAAASATLSDLTASASEAVDSNTALINRMGFFALAALMVTAVGLTYLFRDLSGSFKSLDADIATVMAGDAEVMLQLDVERRDEFGPIAKALAAFRTSLVAGRKQQAAIRAAAAQEEALRREAEDLRFEQAQAEARRAATEKADAEAVRLRERKTAAEIAEVVAACAKGDFSHRLRTDDKEGVFADLCQGMNRIGEVTNEGLGAVRNALNHLAKGDLTYRLPEHFRGVFGEIATTMNQTAVNLTRTLLDLSVSATAVDTSSREISGATENLAQRSQQNAVMLEHTASALEQMTSTIKSSATSAETARTAVEEISVKATAGQAIVNRAVAAIDEIQSSSDGITKILQLMGEISFQTNLLALNAAVEAARAGEAGRGFAVVASEVRALAQRSSEAAHEIAELIETSGSNVKHGVELVHDSGRALQDIVASVADVSTKITEIVNASRDTAHSIGEISTATNEIDRTTQRNTAVFQETSAAVRSLQAEATSLAKAVGAFRLDARSNIAA
ncbi:methyl-accepting chemotaxis protein [Cypionkella sp.]|uniref:methyl-accepting chemotaxis protein n=1 Tax=Cypionkella sp. TaxID=2811411 RepID=UPI003752880C